MALVRAENQDAMLEPKIMTTAIRSTAMSATSRPYSVTAIPCSERTKRETARTGDLVVDGRGKRQPHRAAPDSNV